MLRRIGAVAAGYAAIAVLVMLTDLIFAALVPALRNSAQPPSYYFATVLGTDTLYTIFGGYLCARIAQQHARNATWALMVFGELMGSASAFTLWGIQPHWFAVTLLILYPPAVWVGYMLSRRLLASRLAAAPLKTPSAP